MYRIVNDKKLDDVWRIPCLQPASKEWTGFPTQKHHELIERIRERKINKYERAWTRKNQTPWIKDGFRKRKRMFG